MEFPSIIGASPCTAWIMILRDTSCPVQICDTHDQLWFGIKWHKRSARNTNSTNKCTAVWPTVLWFQALCSSSWRSMAIFIQLVASCHNGWSLVVVTAEFGPWSRCSGWLQVWVSDLMKFMVVLLSVSLSWLCLAKASFAELDFWLFTKYSSHLSLFMIK